MRMCRATGPPDDGNKMFPFFAFGYAAAAFGFFRYVCDTAPVIEEDEVRQQCKIYELFPDRQEEQAGEQIRKAA